jgi:hypothetical protein
MFDEIVSTSKIAKALLCVDAATAQELAGRTVLGQSVLFHQIKLLERVGVGEIAIAVETIPAEYPGLVDRLRAEGMHVSLLRSGAEVAAFGQSAGLYLVQDAAISASADILSGFMRCSAPVVAVLQEEPGWAAFERIDLNRRWAGIAVVDATLLKNSSALPDGWSLGSFLMRSALQAGYHDAMISDQAGNILLYRASAAAQSDLEMLARPKRATSGVVEAALGQVADKALSVLGRHGWYRPLAQWTGVTTAVLALISSIFQYITTSYILAFISVVGLYWRRHLQLSDYRKEESSWQSGAVIAILLATFAILLSAETFIGDAIFHCAVAAGLLWLHQRSVQSRLGAELSPLVIVVLLLGGHLAGFGLWSAKLVIAAMLAALLVSQKLNPN